MKIGLFGGTFDPIHMGHLLMAEAVREAAQLDQVIFLPTGQPPHKGAPCASSRDRLMMLRLALRGNPFFRVSDWEIRQNRQVYTVETLAYFVKTKPRALWHFILGTDSLMTIPKWRQGLSLLKMAQFIAVERPSVPWARLSLTLRRRCWLAPSFPLPFASHVIRDRLARKQSIRYQVPEPVRQYIVDRQLYQRAS